MRFSTPHGKSMFTQFIDQQPSHENGSLPHSLGLKRQITERSVNNRDHSGSSSEEEHEQSYTFLTQTYTDLRYITRGVFYFYLFIFLLIFIDIYLNC